MVDTATKLSKNVFCRYCGHEDNLTFCSQCGLPLDYGMETPMDYLKERVRMIIDPVRLFWFTCTRLLFRPRDFFLRLAEDGVAVGGLHILRSRDDSFPIKFLRPLTPVGYLFIVILIVAIILTTYSGVQEIFQNLIKEKIEALPQDNVLIKPIIWSKPIIASAFPALISELILVLLLFAFMTPYRLILGIKPNRVKLFIEYFWYASVQFLFFLSCIVIAVNVILIQDMHNEETFGLILFIVLLPVFFSIYYFLIVPMRLFPALFGTSRRKILGAYFAMYFFMSYFVVSLPVFYFVYILAKLDRYLRGRREVGVNVR